MPTRSRPWCSTRSTPASVVGPPPRSASRLAALARTHQVIVVTHLAQVAAYADRHYVVDASSGGRVGTSDVRVVAGADREAELARMLGGTDGATARAHARRPDRYRDRSGASGQKLAPISHRRAPRRADRPAG